MVRNKFIKMRANETEQSRWSALSSAKGKSLSKIIREFLDRQSDKAGIPKP